MADCLYVFTEPKKTEELAAKKLDLRLFEAMKARRPLDLRVQMYARVGEEPFREVWTEPVACKLKIGGLEVENLRTDGEGLLGFHGSESR